MWGKKNSDLFALIYVSEEDTQGRLLSRIMDASDEGLGKKQLLNRLFKCFIGSERHPLDQQSSKIHAIHLVDSKKHL